MLEYSLFNRLPLWSQVDVLKKQGTVVAQRQHKDWTITLFYLNDHFIELWSKPQLEVVGSFQLTANPIDILEPYLEEVTLSEFTKIL